MKRQRQMHTPKSSFCMATSSKMPDSPFLFDWSEIDRVHTNSPLTESSYANEDTEFYLHNCRNANKANVLFGVLKTTLRESWQGWDWNSYRRDYFVVERWSFLLTLCYLRFSCSTLYWKCNLGFIRLQTLRWLLFIPGTLILSEILRFQQSMQQPAKSQSRSFFHPLRFDSHKPLPCVTHVIMRSLCNGSIVCVGSDPCQTQKSLRAVLVGRQTSANLK